MIDFLRECMDTLAYGDAAAGRLREAVAAVESYVTEDTWAGAQADAWVSWWEGQKSTINGVLDDLPGERQVCYSKARQMQADWNRQQVEARQAAAAGAE